MFSYGVVLGCAVGPNRGPDGVRFVDDPLSGAVYGRNGHGAMVENGDAFMLKPYVVSAKRWRDQSAWSAAWTGAQQGYYAWADGLNPSGNPYAEMGYYNENDGALKASRFFGGVSQQAALGMITAGAFNAGSSSVFWSGYRQGAKTIADRLGTTIGKTIGGRTLQGAENLLGRWVGESAARQFMDPAWRAGSAIYTMNAKSGFQFVIVQEGAVWSQVERPLLQLLGHL